MGTNIVVSVTSYGPVATEPKYQGGSNLNSQFSSLYNTACGLAPAPVTATKAPASFVSPRSKRAVPSHRRHGRPLCFLPPHLTQRPKPTGIRRVRRY